jgi:hypothetical protein
VPALVVVNDDAVRLERTADEETLAREPEVVALIAEEAEHRERGDLQRLPLVERVLLQLLPILVPVTEHLGHQGIQV